MVTARKTSERVSLALVSPRPEGSAPQNTPVLTPFAFDPLGFQRLCSAPIWTSQKLLAAAASPLTPLSEKAKKLIDTILDTYGDPDAKKKLLDELTVETFLREEVFISQGVDTDLLLLDYFLDLKPPMQNKLFKFWQQNTKMPAAAELTLADFIRVLMEAKAGENYKPKEHSETVWVHVGDSHASEKENTDRTTRYAKNLFNVPYSSVVLERGDLKNPGKVTFEFESVNWTQADDLKFIGADPAAFVKPSAAFIAPESYDGNFPPTAEEKEAWAKAHDKKKPDGYFYEITPKRSRDKQTLSVEGLPPDTNYTVWVQAGERKHETDPLDNFDVAITTEHIYFASDVSKPQEETIVLGEEFDRVTMRKNGRVVPNPNASEPGTSNNKDSGTPRLLKRAYAKYHPRVRNPKAPFWKDERTFEVKPGQAYTFSTEISGIDVGGTITLQNGPEKIEMAFGPEGNVYKKGGQTVALDHFEQIEDGDAEPKYYYDRRIPIPGRKNRAWFVEQSQPFHENDDEVITKVIEPGPGFDEKNPKAIYWLRYKMERDSHGRWFTSLWRKEKEKDSFRFVRRQWVEDEYDARHTILRFAIGPMKWTRFDFVAKGSTVKAIFVSSHSNVEADELRFDRIRIKKADEK